MPLESSEQRVYFAVSGKEVKIGVSNNPDKAELLRREREEVAMLKPFPQKPQRERTAAAR
jgi:hypothetical protein